MLSLEVNIDGNHRVPRISTRVHEMQHSFTMLRSPDLPDETLARTKLKPRLEETIDSLPLTKPVIHQIAL